MNPSLSIEPLIKTRKSKVDKQRNGPSRLQTLKSENNPRMTFFKSSLTPETPLGYITLLSTLSSALLVHEIQLQKSLTGPPLVYSQNTPYMKALRHILSTGEDTKETQKTKVHFQSFDPKNRGILTKDIQPSLFVGTRSVMASTAAYILHGPKEKPFHSFREIIHTSDGASLALDWEIPFLNNQNTYNSITLQKSKEDIEQEVRCGPISIPVVIVLHGINNDTSFGYMKHLMRSVSDRGWIACGMNFRGCGGVKMSTPRGYTAAYTGDLRTVVHLVEDRLKSGVHVPVFLVGNSLGANLVTKYLGEEGWSQTLPKCIAGGVTLGNPLTIHSENVPWPWGELLAVGVKKTIVHSWQTFKAMRQCSHFSQALKKVLMARTIGQLDNAMAPFLIRNEPEYPFSSKIGYEDGEAYWKDASSNRYIQHVSVPLLKLSSQDDFLVVNSALKSLGRCLENPNVLVVKTKFGGHLGWQEAPPDGFGIGKSWAANAMSEFIDAVLKMRKIQSDDVGNESSNMINSMNLVEDMYASTQLQSKL
jgi:predicted alpha/beta-fold hydrolase